jgi:hypothetical protein
MRAAPSAARPLTRSSTSSGRTTTRA